MMIDAFKEKSIIYVSQLQTDVTNFGADIACRSME